MIKIAAIGDVHFAEDARGCMREHLERLPDGADVLVVAGDITRHGLADEAKVFADEVAGIGVPVVAVLGNHDYHCDEQDGVREALEGADVIVLESDATIVETEGGTLGIAGTKGFGGGFAGASGTEFGEPLMKAFIGHTRELAENLGGALDELDTDFRLALLHYSPVEATLTGERLELYPFLGSYLLAEAIDDAGADLVVHGHAHGGTEKGVTPAGIHVRNVAMPMLRRSYNIYCLNGGQSVRTSST